ncbi:MAG: hypothetical protein QMD32_09335 [Smithellaceae bacterium]|nr:hypothetical protein [Smithellaceae bacterium]
MNRQPANTAKVITETFYDMALYLEALFSLYGVNQFLAEEIIQCIDKGYVKSMKVLKARDLPRTAITRKSAVDRFIRKLEQEVKP